jgi:hypothetical protein
MDLRNAYSVDDFVKKLKTDRGVFLSDYDKSKKYLEEFKWHNGIVESYVGMFYPGILSVFLYRIEPSYTKEFEDDDWVWVIVGDLPSAYITVEDSPNPACALDSYVGAMMEWVEAVENGDPVDDLIPVNVHPNAEMANLLRRRLDFISEEILTRAEFSDDLKK